MLVKVTLVGDRELQGKLDKLGKSLYDFGKEFRGIGRDLTNYYAEKPYASEGQIFGQRWKALKPKYEEDKAKRYPGRGILVRTGKMRKNYTFTSSQSAVRIQNKTSYFIYHQSAKSRKKMPRRLLFAFNQEILGFITKTIKTGIIERIRSV